MTEQQPSIVPLAGDDWCQRSENLLHTAARRASADDATATALVAIGYALLAGYDQRDRASRHGPDVCGYDFDDLADLMRVYERDPARQSAADDLREWFDEQGLEVRALGGHPETEADAFREWGPA